MATFEVRCCMGDDQFCIEVPTDCSVGDVLKKASGQSEVKGVSLWYSDIVLNIDHLFADYFEPETVYHVRLGGNYAKGTLWNSSEANLTAVEVNLKAAQLLMEMRELKWSMDEFKEKAGDFAPTLVLIKMRNGTECGGVAGVPWPWPGANAADPAKDSFIFSLGATPARFDLVNPGNALSCVRNHFGFGGDGYDLCILSDGKGCGSLGWVNYSGPRERGQLVGGTALSSMQPYERWELWGL
jgi:hypothetical protein